MKGRSETYQQFAGDLLSIPPTFGSQYPYALAVSQQSLNALQTMRILAPYDFHPPMPPWS